MRAPNRPVVLAFVAASLFACGGGSGPAPAGSASAQASAASAAASGAPSAPASSSAAASPSGAASAAPSAAASAAPAADPSRLVVEAIAKSDKEKPTEGKPKQGVVLRAKVTGKVAHISFPGHKTTILEDGAFLIGFARDAAPKETLKLTFDDGSVLERAFDVEQRTYETDRIDGLPKNQVDLDAATKAKVAKAEAKLDEVRMQIGAESCFSGPFAWPVKGKLTSRYGQPRVLNGTDAGPHWGVDITAKVGTPVHAPACGKVIAVERDVPLSGNLVIIAHGRGLSSTFIHLDKIDVKVGDEVKAGQKLATVGLTGRTNGPHLDWRMNLYDIRVDPELIAPPMR
jgi:murein DD-endopeptidase MepM/ murein hydrolase activator NlpD